MVLDKEAKVGDDIGVSFGQQGVLEPAKWGWCVRPWREGRLRWLAQGDCGGYAGGWSRPGVEEGEGTGWVRREED